MSADQSGSWPQSGLRQQVRQVVDDDAAEPRLGHKDRRLPSSATTPSPDTPVTDAYVAD
jgi:hypothetical protein